jgi:hypothetical protein
MMLLKTALTNAFCRFFSMRGPLRIRDGWQASATARCQRSVTSSRAILLSSSE